MAAYNETTPRVTGEIGANIRLFGHITVNAQIKGEIIEGLSVIRIYGIVQPHGRTIGNILGAGSTGSPGDDQAFQPGEIGSIIGGGTPATPGVTLD